MTIISNSFQNIIIKEVSKYGNSYIKKKSK